MSYQGKPIKASRLFAGYEHEQQVKRLADHFHKLAAYASGVDFDADMVEELRRDGEERELAAFSSFEQAYHRLMMDIMKQQVASTQLVLEGTEVKRIFVDGGFGKNQVYMHLLAEAFPEIEVFAASVPQATAMGAALAIHPHWNSRFLPGDIIELKFYK
jgi:hypothetical protein